jgi:hypothetical protein
MGKFPWGIIAGICAMIWSFTLVALVAIYVVSGMMFVEVSTDDGLRESWFMLPLFIAQAVTGVGCALSLVLHRFSENAE